MPSGDDAMQRLYLTNQANKEKKKKEEEKKKREIIKKRKEGRHVMYRHDATED